MDIFYLSIFGQYFCVLLTIIEIRNVYVSPLINNLISISMTEREREMQSLNFEVIVGTSQNSTL